MADKEPTKSLQQEIKELEDRLQTLPDNQVQERREVREKLIKKYIQNGQIINI
jgi:flagella basal body P-ring formation protein FlgA